MLFREQPRYDHTQFGSSQWTVIAACASTETLESESTIEIAVAPTAALDEDDVHNAREGNHSDAVTCDF